MKYIITLNKSDDAWHMECNRGIREDGTEKILHNEIGCSFIFIGGTLHVLGGYHIGTEDFDFGEGDNWVLEKYHPGIKKQLLELVRNQEDPGAFGVPVYA